MRFLAFLLAIFAALPAAADWITRQSADSARAEYEGERYALWISCQRGRGFELAILDRTLRGGEFQGVDSVMMWITTPDGRTDRWPVDVFQEGPSLSGELIVSEFQLGFFRNGESFVLDAPVADAEFLRGGMKGTGAARLAFLERCGL